MRKSFTWFLSLMVFLFVFAASGFAQEQQETVELYAEDASSCYMEANDYAVTISVRDFIQLDSFDLDLDYNNAVFAFTGVSGLHGSLGGTTVSESAGVINMNWSGSATTIGDNVVTPVLVLHFSVLGFPGNISTSFTSDLEWITHDFWYNDGVNPEIVNTDIATDGSLEVSVDLTGIEVNFTTETCYGGEVTVNVTAPPASMYLFNEDPVVANWDWTSSPSYLVSAGEVVTVRVKDASGCISLVEIVNVPETVDPVAFTVTTQDPSCYGAKGSVVINATGGNAPYHYFIATDTTGVITEKGNFQFSQDTGTYYVNVQDANDCADLYWQEIRINPNLDTLEVDAVPTDILCYGTSTGSIATSVVKGDLTMVSLDGVVWHALPYTFINLAAGIYDVHAKNDAGCTIVLEDVVVAQPAQGISFDIEIDDTSCGGGVDDGVITVTDVIGGTPPYEYSLDGSTWTTDSIFTGLMPTYYSLWVRDDNGCTIAYSNPNGTGNTIAVQSPDDIMYVPDVTPPICSGDDATISIIDVTGGTETYIYSFDGGTTWGSVTTMSWPYPYDTVTVAVANYDSTCPVPKMVYDIDNPDTLMVTVTDTLPPTCIDGNDGNVTLLIEGGVAPYYYTVNESSEKMTDDAVTHIRLNVGTHTITVRDAAGCEYTTEIEVTISLEENQIVATQDANIDCFGDEVGIINVDFISWAEGVTGNEPTVRSVQYYVENSEGVISAFTPGNQGAEPTLFSAGTYTVWVVDQYTCESNMDTAVVTQNPELIISSVVANAASCFESFEGIITIYATGGNTDELEYAVVNNEGALGNITDDKWLPFDTYNSLVNPPLSTVSFNVDKGTYWIAVRDDDCDEKQYGPINVAGYEELLVDEDDIDPTDPLCNGETNGTITVPMAAVSGGAGAYKFTLLVDDEGDWVEYDEDYTDLATGEFTGLPEGTYAVLVEDAEDCPSYTTGPIELEDPDELVMSIDYLNIRCEGSNDGVITIMADGGTPNYWYAINNQLTWVAFGAGNDEKTYIATEPGMFVIWVKDANGCTSDPDTITIMEPTALGAEIDVTDVSCYGGSDGEIDIVGTGGWEGMTSYEFKVGANGSWSTSTTITGLNASVGNDTLFVRDVNSYGGNYQDLDCIYQVLFVVDQPDPITYDVEIKNVSCKDGSDGTLTVTVLSGGTPYVDLVGDTDGYDIRITGDAYSSGWIRTGIDYKHTFTGLAHSHYTVYIMDAKGCTLAPTVGDDESPWMTIESWEVEEPDTYLGFEATWLNDVTCYNGEDGSFKVDATGGTPPYKYYAGLSIPPNGGGHILVPAPASNSPLWEDNDTLMVGAGTWVVWVMDAGGCIIGGEEDELGNPVNEWRVKVEQPDSVLWDWVWIDADPDYKYYVRPSCYGLWDGEIPLDFVTGGTGLYGAHIWGKTFDGDTVNLWYTDIEDDGLVLGGVPASDANGLWVTVMDENGCTSMMDTIFIDQPDPLEVTLQESPDNYSCYGAVEGWIEAYATGGNEDLPGVVRQYQLLKNGVVHTPWQSIASAFLVQVGNEFVVQVRDIVPGRQTCVTESDTLYMPTPAKVEFTYEDLTCYGSEKPSVKIIATGTEGRQFKVWYKQIEDQPVNAPYIEYNGWFDDEIVIDTIFEYDNENYDDLHYAVYVEDDHGCMSPVDTLTFDNVQTPFVVDVTVGDVVDCATEVMVSAIGGVSPYMVVVNNTDTTSFTSDVTLMLVGGTEMIDVYDAHLCMQSFEETLEYVNSMDTTFYVYPGDSAELVYAPAMIDTMLAPGSYQVLYDLSEGCVAVINIEVIESEGPNLLTRSPLGRIGDNHPIFIMGFEDNVELSEMGGYLTVTPLDSTEPVLIIQLTEDMFNGDSVIVDYDWTVVGKLDIKTKYVVHVDSAAIVGADDNFPWEGIQNQTWVFSTGPNWYNGVDDKPFSSASFVVYPNPFGDEINITNIEKLTRVIVTNIAGQRVLDVEYPEERIRTANLVSGVYFVSMFTDSGLAKTDKIVKR